MPGIKVLIVDDSAVARQAIAAALSRDRGIEVTAAVADPLLAMQRMRLQWPDVVVLDVEMPRMDGMTFLRAIMRERPTPVVMCSALTTRGAAASMQALACGAVAVIGKPRIGVRNHLLGAADDLVHAVRSAAAANVERLRSVAAPPVPPDDQSGWLPDATEKLVAIGTSTGGPQALESVLSALPPVAPGILVVQHMPEKFTAAFARRLDDICCVEVKEAADGDRVRPGRVLLAPGGRHLTVRRSGAFYEACVSDGPLVHHHRPSVDVLFRSVAKAAGPNALGIILTGMGADGAVGLKVMHDARARTLAQDEASCVVFGMPREAIALGAVDAIVPLSAMAAEIARFRSTAA